MKTKSPTAIYFKKLKIQNIKCFSDIQTLNLCDAKGRPNQWTLILGDNGIGKTTLLQSLAWMEPVPRMNDPDTKIIGITPALNDAQNLDFEKLLRAKQDGDSFIRVEFSQGTCLTDFEKSFKETKEQFTECSFAGGTNGDLKEADPKGSDGKHEKLLLVAYGANRQQGIANLNKKSNYDFAAQMIVSNTELIDVEALLTSLDYAASKDKAGHEKNRLEKLKSILKDILPDLIGKDPIQIYGPRLPGSDKPYGVKFSTRYGEVPISALSQGYKSTMGWTVDLAWKLFVKYPNAQKPLNEPAVVLIDEIDLHLHPVWQRKIITDLSKHFPNTQFIATAHSPLIVQSAINANLAVVIKEGNHVRIENSPEFFKTWRVDQILTSELFGMTSARNQEIEVKINERLTLINKSKRTKKDNLRLKELDQEIDALPTLEGEDESELMDYLLKTAKALNIKPV